MRTNWLWDTTLKEDRVRAILKDARDPRFFIYAEKLLARLSDPGEVFLWIDPAVFMQHWEAIRERMKKDAWAGPAVERWQRFFEQEIPVERLNVALQIRSARASLGISQRQMAEKMGVIQQYVSNLENGRENVTLDTLRKIAGVFQKKLVVQFK